uniref:Suppressor of cancer cell invasion n=1 Tax=Tetraodon nigroviridis TaxID=99883 RepID=H3CBT8_TETNG
VPAAALRSLQPGSGASTRFAVGEVSGGAGKRSRAGAALRRVMTGAEAEEDIPLGERKTVTDFCYLLDKSKQLFNGLRDLPQYGHKQWQSYFGRTFDVYTKLWKFQQQHRWVDSQKIACPEIRTTAVGSTSRSSGQLTRPCVSSGRNQAQVFQVLETSSASSGLRRTSASSTKLGRLETRDQEEILVQETGSSEGPARPTDPDLWGQSQLQVHRDKDRSTIWCCHDDGHLLESSPWIRGTFSRPRSLVHSLLMDPAGADLGAPLREVSSWSGLCRLQGGTSGGFYRLLLVCVQESSEKPAKRENPHKYLLYKPTFSQLFTFLSASFKELPANSVLLVYLSAAGVFPCGNSDYEGPYDFGGILTNTNRDVVNGETVQKRNQAQKEMHCLHPGDLFPFTRKPLFIIVDSSNSTAYKNFTNLFGQPLVCLLSPTTYPKGVQDQSQRGSLFTLFLYSPLLAFSSVCGLASLQAGLWERAQEYLRKVNRDIGQLLTRSRTIDQAFLQFFGDEFLRLLLIRFVFCSATLRLHKVFRESQSFPESYPELPKKDTVESSQLQKHVLELAAMLEVQNLFWEEAQETY